MALSIVIKEGGEQIVIKDDSDTLVIDSLLRDPINDNIVRLTEIADPAAPSPNTGLLYARDNGSGKTQLVVRFPTGAIQVIATEP